MACVLKLPVCCLPTLSSERLSRGHLLAAVSLWVVGSQALLEGRSRILNRRDDYMVAFDRYTHTLIDVQMRFPRHCGRQANTQIVAPSFDVQYGFDHDPPPFATV